MKASVDVANYEEKLRVQIRFHEDVLNYSGFALQGVQNMLG